MLKPINLKNGMTVLRMPKNSSESFLIGLVVKTGSSVEEGNYPLGLSGFVERLFWKGTDKHPSAGSLNQTLEGMGGEFISHTGKEMTEFYLRVPSYHQYRAISLLSEIIQHSNFSQRDIELAKEIVISEIKEFDDIEDVDKLGMTLSHLFDGRGLGSNGKGTIESLTTISQQHVADYLSHQYIPSNCYVVLAGNFETKSCMELLEQEWNLWNPRSRSPRQPQVKDMSEDIFPKMQFRQRGLSRTNIAISFVLDGGFKSYEHASDVTSADSGVVSKQPKKEEDLDKQKIELLSEWSKLAVLNTILGQGLSSRLWLKCVEDEVLFDTIGSNLELYTYSGFLQIGGNTTENTQFTFAFESILSVLDGLKKTTPSINEFTKAREYLKGRLILDQEDIVSSTVWQVYLYIVTGLDIDKNELIDYINQVDSSHVRSLAMDMFVPERMVVTTVGTAKNTTLLNKLISKYIGSPVTSL